MGGEIGVKAAPEEELAAIDPGRMQFGLLDKFAQFVARHAELAKSRRRIDSENRADLAAAQMKIELGRKVGVGQSVAIRHGVVFVIAEISCGGTGDAAAGHGQFAGVGKRHLPVAAMVDTMHIDRIGLEVDCHIAMHRIKVKKIIANDLTLITHAQYKPIEPEMRVMPHDVKENGLRADRYHRFRAEFGHLLEAGAGAAAQYESRNLGIVHSPPPPNVSQRLKSRPATAP